MKRFRGQATDKPFGDGTRRVLRATGEGAVVYALPGKRLRRVELEGGPAYFRDDAVFAFEGAIPFENGRVASKLGTDLDLVHFRGQGQLLLATAAEVVAIDVRPGMPVRVPATALVGWIGTLTPQFAKMAEGAGVALADEASDPLGVELAGEGRVLLEGAVA